MYESILNHPSNLFGQFERLRRELDDVFGVSGLHSGIRSVAPGTVPAVNVGHTPTSVEIYAFAPGLDASKIELTLDRGVLRISGERASGIPAMTTCSTSSSAGASPVSMPKSGTGTQA